MTFVVTENCINCKFQDCIEVCPVDCFYEGENFLVIHPEECIDCGVCEPQCPADAIKPDTESGLDEWLAINAKYAELWPNITEVGLVPPDAEEWNGKPGKAALLVAPTGEKPRHPPKPPHIMRDNPSGSSDEKAVAEGYEVDGLNLEKLDEGSGRATPPAAKKLYADDDERYELEGLKAPMRKTAP